MRDGGGGGAANVTLAILDVTYQKRDEGEANPREKEGVGYGYK